MNIHAPLSSQDIASINALVRDVGVTAAQKQELASLTGRSISTVRRWFQQGGTGGLNLIPSSVAGWIPVTMEGGLTDEMRLRVIAAMVVTGGGTADLFHKKMYSQEGTEPNLTGAISKMQDVMQSKFHQLGLTQIEFIATGEGFVFIHEYSSPAEGEYISLHDLLELIQTGQPELSDTDIWDGEPT